MNAVHHLDEPCGRRQMPVPETPGNRLMAFIRSGSSQSAKFHRGSEGFTRKRARRRNIRPI